MHKTKTILLLLAITLTGCATKELTKSLPPTTTSTKTFDDLFFDKTLRVDYYRVGNRQHDSVQLSAYRDNLSPWAGSLTHLLDPFDNGQYRISMRDPLTNNELYSRTFNSIFQEYCSTPAGADSTVSYEEVLKLPMPKQPVTLVMQERGKDLKFHTQAQWHFDPQHTPLLPATTHQPKHQQPEVVNLQIKGNVHQKIDIVILPEGYGIADSAKMMADFLRFEEALFQHSPFRERRNDFNVYGVKVFGSESGITDPTHNLQVESAIGASYNTFGADRYLMTFHLFQLHDCLSGLPCDHIVIMANSDTYGGGAIYNFYAISSLNKKAEVVLTHELGHSIGGLADEYVDEDLSYGEIHQYIQEPIEPNLTTLVDFQSKWAASVESDTPIPTPDNIENANHRLGAYEGAGYHSKGFYRPLPHCMMRDYAPFCPVCTQRLNAVFDLYTQ